ncbi:MAG: bacterioferritin [Acidimicrobiales bacterium]|nr:bacterioferritin [Acidimicrobiales bacterium]
MNGAPEVIEILNEILTAELTAINQYFIHAKMNEHWGLGKLAGTIRAESIDEMRDADALIDRILFLGGVPNVQRLNPVRVGEDVAEQLTIDAELEVDAIGRYNRAIALTVEHGDNGTRAMLEERLQGEEAHLDWIESQLELIRQVGLENYLASQIDG